MTASWALRRNPVTRHRNGVRALLKKRALTPNSSQQAFGDREVDALELAQVIDRNFLVDLVDGPVERAELDDGDAVGCDEPAIRGAAAGRELRIEAGLGFDGGLDGGRQLAGLGQERLPALRQRIS